MSDETQVLPSPADDPAVQEALSVRYVDKAGLAWLPTAQQWALFSNSGKLVSIRPSLVESEVRTLCENQDRAWRARMDEELEHRQAGPVVTAKALGDLDL